MFQVLATRAELLRENWPVDDDVVPGGCCRRLARQAVLEVFSLEEPYILALLVTFETWGYRFA